ncbi:hypothetical protein R1sor_012852 [Riccia sorocarpa]|uniref:Uncharacterized protein n=1 Tax=Riccia sorocarpa TaxID=122646 RepID=A0ABD3I629_9MARC
MASGLNPSYRYFLPGCEEQNRLKLLEEERLEIRAFDLRFILPGHSLYSRLVNAAYHDLSETNGKGEAPPGKRPPRSELGTLLEKRNKAPVAEEGPELQCSTSPDHELHAGDRPSTEENTKEETHEIEDCAAEAARILNHKYHDERGCSDEAVSRIIFST